MIVLYLLLETCINATFLLKGEGEDDEGNGDDLKDDDDDDNSVFQRLEESRQALEQELGFDRFLRVYRYLQVSKILVIHIGTNQYYSQMGCTANQSFITSFCL